MDTVESFLNLAKEGRIPETNETYFVSRKIKDFTNNSWSRLVSDCTIEYLAGVDRFNNGVKNGEQLTILRRAFQTMKVCPLKTKMDGNCLLHAVAKAIWGIEGVYHEVMRKLVTEELTQHKSFYQNSVDKKSDDDYNDTEYEIFLQESRKSGEKLQVIHIFALANIIKRPIILYAAEIDMHQLGIHEQGVAGLILPTRHGAKAVAGRPIAISWSDDLRNHYVPLCLIEGEQFEWPLLQTVYQKSLKEGETYKDYIIYDNENRKGLASLMMEMESQRVHQPKMGHQQRFQTEKDSSGLHKQLHDVALEMLLKIQEEQLKEAIKQYNSQRNQRMKQGRKQSRYRSVGDKLVRIIDSDEDEEDEDEKEYDIVVPVQLKSSKGNLMIGFNFDDNPFEVAKLWVSKLKMPISNLPSTVEFVRKYQIYAKENAHSFKEKKKVPRVVSSYVRFPTKTSKYIPYSGQYYENPLLNPKNFNFILETSEKLSADVKLSENDLNELKQLNATIVGSKEYASAVFSKNSLSLITSLLKPGRWPDESLFQIIDFVRVIIMFKNAATNFLESLSVVEFENTIFGLLMAQAIRDNLPYPKMKTLMGFILNLFFQQCLHNFIVKFQFRIIHMISGIVTKRMTGFEEGRKVQIIEIALRIISNYALLWKNNVQHPDQVIQNDSANFAMTLVLDILKLVPKSDSLVQQGLISIGTILLRNGGSKINKDDVDAWSSSTNQVVAECAQYIIHLLSSEVVNQHCI